jgi:uncharacterized protein (DUF1499 family)
MGLLTGSRPKKLGFANGTFVRDQHKDAWKPNWVSSTVAADDKHHIAALRFKGDAQSAWAALERALAALPRVTIVTRDEHYLHAESKSKTMGFGDDMECALDAKAKLIHVRAGARLGIRDFDANRKRIEALRVAFGAQ